MFEAKGKFAKAIIYTDTIEGKAYAQVEEILNSPATENCRVAIMPDVHAGKGCTIGTTISVESGKIIPNLVGVDIGCGMLTVKLPFKGIDLKLFDEIVHKVVPAGFDVNDEILVDYGYVERLDCFKSLKNVDRIKKSCGTLGGGNHFIEIDKGDDGQLYLIIHSGSRNLGKQVCEYYQNLAYERYIEKYILSKEERLNIINRLKEQGRQTEIQDAISNAAKEKRMNMPKINKELCFLEGMDYYDYLGDMQLCQRFASLNRKTIANSILRAYGGSLTYGEVFLDECEWFETIHNYIDVNAEGPIVLRKGAVSAKEGEKLLIPINMRDGSLLCTGKGNPEWNYSAPHGAGRVMSRTLAKERISLEAFEKSMEGIYTSCVSSSTIDESPMAYKSIDEITEYIGETVDILEIIKPIYNFKAN